MTDAAYKLVAFDLDGTLVDTESLALPNLLKFIAHTYGLKLTLDTWVAQYHGMSGPSLLAKLNADHGTHLVWEDFGPRRFAFLEAEIREKGFAPAPGMLQMLRRIVARGQQVAVVSNSSPMRIGLTLEITHGQHQHGVLLPQLFEGHIFSGTDPAHPTRKSKPAPDVYLAAAAYYGVSPAACLALEDSPTGVAAAVGAGFTCWGYTGLAHENGYAAKLTTAGAARIIPHWDAFMV